MQGSNLRGDKACGGSGFNATIAVASHAVMPIPFFWLGHKRGIKCVYVEVFDRIDKPTISGKICRRYADAFVVQWPEQLEVYPGSVNLGSIF